MKLRYYRTEKSGELRNELLLTRPEQESWYKECLKRVLTDTREVLDQLEYYQEYKVNWNNYSAKYIKHMCIKCYKKYPTTRRKACTCGCTKFKNLHYGVGLLRQNQPQRGQYDYKRDI